MIVKDNCLYDSDNNLLYHMIDCKYAILDEREIEVFSGEVNVYEGAHCIVRNSAKAYIYDNSSATYYGESSGIVNLGSNIRVCDNAEITVHKCKNLWVVNNAKAHIYYAGQFSITTRDNATVFAYMGDAKIEAWDASTVYAYASNVVYAYDKTKVYTFNRATVFSHHASTIYASGFGTVYKKGGTVKKRNFFGEVVKQVFTVKQDMLVYKKLRDDKIATLKLVKGQKFIAAKYEKCRTDRAIVVDISDNEETGVSSHDPSFVYKFGEEVVADYYDETFQECTGGIHFFLTREEAERW